MSSKSVGRPSTRAERQARVAGYAAFRDLVRLVNEAPKPAPIMLKDSFRDEQRRGLAPAMAWGWLQRTLRSGEAAIELDKRGYGVEAAPLVRSSLEHAIRMLWAVTIGDKFVEVALLAQKGTNDKLFDAQKDGWHFDPELAAAFEKHSNEASGEHLSLSSLTALKNAVHSSPETRENLGSLYMAWLFYTSESHPTVNTARAYYHLGDSGHYVGLLSQPKNESEVAAAVNIALVGAAHGYSKLAALESHFEPRLQDVMTKHLSSFQHLPETSVTRDC